MYTHINTYKYTVSTRLEQESRSQQWCAAYSVSTRHERQINSVLQNSFLNRFGLWYRHGPHLLILGFFVPRCGWVGVGVCVWVCVWVCVLCVFCVYDVCVRVRVLRLRVYMRIWVCVDLLSFLFIEHRKTVFHSRRRFVNRFDLSLINHYNMLPHIATGCNTLHHTATHCNTMQHTATHRSALQRTASYVIMTYHHMSSHKSYHHMS